jgi:putative toxin-antitoxin system antitoxin component (TIGR02293 family)
MGKKNILSENDVLVAARAGVPRKVVNDIMEITGFTLNEIGKFVHLTPRTLQRKKPTERLDTAISEKVLLIQNLYIKGSMVMGTIENFKDWMNTPNMSFDKARPKDFLDTFSGIDFLMHELGRLEHGYAF